LSKPDINLISFTGVPNGNIWITDSEAPARILFWGSDRQPGVKRKYTLHMSDYTVGRHISDTVKLSGPEDFDLTIIGEVQGGKEDCIDINNNCKRVIVRAYDGLHSNGRYCITLKGDSDEIHIESLITKHGAACDVALGEHSDQDMDRSESITLNLQSKDGKPVTWWRFNATTPTLIAPGPYKNTLKIPGFFRSAFAKLYALLKQIGLPI